MRSHNHHGPTTVQVFCGEAYHSRPGATVADLMTRQVSTVHKEEPLLQVAERFLRTGLRCFPVVDEARAVIGLMRRRDLLAALCAGGHLESTADASTALEEHTRQGSMITKARAAEQVVGPETNKPFH